MPYYDQPNPYYQFDPYYHPFLTYNSSFEEKALQIINNLNRHSDQLSVELNKKKVGEVPSQLESNLEGSYPSPNYSLSFEEKALQIIDNINRHSDQLLVKLNKKKVGEVPSQPESNLEGPYLTHNFNNPLSFFKQSNITLEDNWITKQPCTIMETYSIEVDKSNWWDE